VELSYHNRVLLGYKQSLQHKKEKVLLEIGDFFIPSVQSKKIWKEIKKRIEKEEKIGK